MNQDNITSQGWQPIETAPSDGTKVFLWLPEIEDYQRARRIESFRRCQNSSWENEYGNGPAYNVNARVNPRHGYKEATWEPIKPSHWMPLPPPPGGK